MVKTTAAVGMNMGEYLLAQLTSLVAGARELHAKTGPSERIKARAEAVDTLYFYFELSPLVPYGYNVCAAQDRATLLLRQNHVSISPLVISTACGRRCYWYVDLLSSCQPTGQVLVLET
jgi:hypothetical protein